MDVDTENERMETDNEHMEYDEELDEELGSAQDDDGDEMMADDEVAEAMDAEPIVTTDAAIPIPAALPSPFIAKPLLSPAKAPNTVSPFAQPIPPATSVAPETEMSTVTEETPSLDASNIQNTDHPLTGLAPTTPFDSIAALVLEVASQDPSPSSSLLPLPPTSEISAMPTSPAPHKQRQLALGRTPRPPNADLGDEGVAEEYCDDDGPEEEAPHYPLDVHTLPAIILNLPALGGRVLFVPLHDGGQDTKHSVWLKGRQEELGEASLSDVLSAIRAEMAREGLVKSGEMVVAEKQMDLKMGEDDVNLQSITLLELLQLHHGCDLPTPVQLYISFEPNRFITRFNAISSELKTQDERRKSTAVIGNGEAGVEKGDPGDEGGQNEEAGEDYDDLAYDEEVEEGTQKALSVDGDTVKRELSEVGTLKPKLSEDSETVKRNPSDDGDTVKRKREVDSVKEQRDRRRGADVRAEYGGSRKAERPEDLMRDHPNAEWAGGRPTGPMHVPSGRIFVQRERREAESETPDQIASPRRRTQDVKDTKRRSPKRGETDEDEGKSRLNQHGIFSSFSRETEFTETSLDAKSLEPGRERTGIYADPEAPLNELALLRKGDSEFNDTDTEDDRLVEEMEDDPNNFVDDSYAGGKVINAEAAHQLIQHKNERDLRRDDRSLTDDKEGIVSKEGGTMIEAEQVSPEGTVLQPGTDQDAFTTPGSQTMVVRPSRDETDADSTAIPEDDVEDPRTPALSGPDGQLEAEEDMYGGDEGEDLVDEGFDEAEDVGANRVEETVQDIRPGQVVDVTTPAPAIEEGRDDLLEDEGYFSRDDVEKYDDGVPRTGEAPIEPSEPVSPSEVVPVSPQASPALENGAAPDDYTRSPSTSTLKGDENDDLLDSALREQDAEEAEYDEALDSDLGSEIPLSAKRSAYDLDVVSTDVDDVRSKRPKTRGKTE